MFSSTKPGRIKISRLLIATTIVLFLLLSLDRLLYLAEKRNREGFISETEPVAGQGEFPANGQIFRYEVMARKDYMMTYWTEVWSDGKLDSELSQAFYYMPGQEGDLEHYLRFTMENGDASSSAPRWSWTHESINSEKKTGLFYEGKWLKFSLGNTATLKSSTTISIVPDAMRESLKAVCDPRAASNWVSSRRKIGRWRIEPGKIITLLEIRCGDKDPVVANARDGKRVGSLVYLKVRFDPAKVGSAPLGGAGARGSIVGDSGKYGL
jgi:hypothetical protein